MPARTIVATLALSLSAIVPHDVARAQAGGVAGEWVVDWDSGLRTDKGRVIAVQRRSRGVLTLTQHGDSVSGTWASGFRGPRGEDAGPIPVRGLLRGGALALVAEAARPGAPPPGITFQGELANGALTGTMYIVLGSLPPAPRRWEARRK
jgi:hypothetical protein